MTKKIKLNVGLRGHKAGEIVTIDEFCSYQDKVYWERRIKDAEIDKCCEIITEANKKEKEKPNK